VDEEEAESLKKRVLDLERVVYILLSVGSVRDEDLNMSEHETMRDVLTRMQARPSVTHPGIPEEEEISDEEHAARSARVRAMLNGMTYGEQSKKPETHAQRVQKAGKLRSEGKSNREVMELMSYGSMQEVLDDVREYLNGPK